MNKNNMVIKGAVVVGIIIIITKDLPNAQMQTLKILTALLGLYVLVAPMIKAREENNLSETQKEIKEDADKYREKMISAGKSMAISIWQKTLAVSKKVTKLVFGALFMVESIRELAYQEMEKHLEKEVKEREVKQEEVKEMIQEEVTLSDAVEDELISMVQTKKSERPVIFA